MKANKYFVFGVSLIMVLILAACGGAPDPDPAADDPAATAVEVEPSPTTQETEPEPAETDVPPEPTPTAVEPEPTAAADEPGDDAEDPAPTAEPETVSAGDPAAGEAHFEQVCAACHGPGGEGIEGLGKDLTTSEFVAGLSDEELLAFIQEGRPADHPDNTTGVAMPPRGGNPDFGDDDLLDIIAYIRTLQEE